MNTVNTVGVALVGITILGFFAWVFKSIDHAIQEAARKVGATPVDREGE
jgi:hypothetical protein